MVEEDPNIAGVGLAYIGTAATAAAKGQSGRGHCWLRSGQACSRPRSTVLWRCRSVAQIIFIRILMNILSKMTNDGQVQLGDHHGSDLLGQGSKSAPIFHTPLVPPAPRRRSTPRARVGSADSRGKLALNVTAEHPRPDCGSPRVSQQKANQYSAILI